MIKPVVYVNAIMVGLVGKPSDLVTRGPVFHSCQSFDSDLNNEKSSKYEKLNGIIFPGALLKDSKLVESLKKMKTKKNTVSSVRCVNSRRKVFHRGSEWVQRRDWEVSGVNTDISLWFYIACLQLVIHRFPSHHECPIISFHRGQYSLIQLWFISPGTMFSDTVHETGFTRSSLNCRRSHLSFAINVITM